MHHLGIFTLTIVAVTPLVEVGCTQSTSQVSTSRGGDLRTSGTSSPSTAAINGSKHSLFTYNVNQITELTLGKFDPSNGDRWMTAIKRTDNATKNRGNGATWEFTSLPDGNTNQDRKANATFIMHLLDSLQGLRKVADAPKGSLDSLGLDPPRYVLRLKTNDTTHEFRIGALSDDQLGNYFTTDAKEIIIASGSALKMLPMITGFDYLRDHSWTPFSTDDVDEIVLSGQGKPFFYAQREGSQWNDKNHRPIQFRIEPKLKQAAHQDAESLLRALAEAQPRELIDEPELVKQVESLSASHADYEVKLIDRHGVHASLKLKLVKLVKLVNVENSAKLGKLEKLVTAGKPGNSPFNESRVYGISSTRPGTLFVLDPQVLTTLEDSKRLSKSL